MSKELTEQQIRDRFLDHVWAMIDHCEKESRRETVREKLELLAFSILTAIDGEAAALPGFIFAPLPHKDDKAFCKSEGEDYYPQNHKIEYKIKADIAGCLHDQFYDRDPRKKEK